MTTHMTKLTWDEYDDIAVALLSAHPDQDPLKVSFPKLHRMVVGLPEFGADPKASNERLLETIQMAWYELKVSQ